MKNKYEQSQNYFDIFKTESSLIPISFIGDTEEMKEIIIKQKMIYEPDKYQKKRGSFQNLRNKNMTSTKKDRLSNKNELDAKPKKMEPIEEEKFQYYINTNIDSFIHIPNPNYGTNDKDLKCLVDLMNEEPNKENGYNNIISEKNISVYKKQREGYATILIKSRAKLPYSKDVIFQAIADLDIRKKWDSVFSELKVVNNDGENGAEILYMIIKSPVFFVSDRDFVQQRKVWKNFPTEKSHILHFISVESPSCPINKKFVRADTIISGYYIQDDPVEEGHSILGILSQTDIKGNIPIMLVNKVAPKSAKSWVKSLYKGCDMVLNAS